MLTTYVAVVDIRKELCIPIKRRVINLIGPRTWKEMLNNRLLITEEHANQQNIDEI